MFRFLVIFLGALASSFASSVVVNNGSGGMSVSGTTLSYGSMANFVIIGDTDTAQLTHTGGNITITVGNISGYQATGSSISILNSGGTVVAGFSTSTREWVGFSGMVSTASAGNGLLTINPSSRTYNLAAGNYTIRSNALSNNQNGIGMISGTVNFPANTVNQSSVSISPVTSTVTAGSSVTFTASGGAGTGAYTWGSSGSGTGTTETVIFNTPGNYTVTVYRAASTGYNVSNTATANIKVTAIQSYARVLNAVGNAENVEVPTVDGSPTWAGWNNFSRLGGGGGWHIFKNTVPVTIHVGVYTSSPSVAFASYVQLPNETARPASGSYPTTDIATAISGGTPTYVGGVTKNTMTVPSGVALTFPPGVWALFGSTGNGATFVGYRVLDINTITAPASLISQTVSISPSAPSISAGQSVTFTASGGSTGYNWGGAGSGTGTTKAITFSTAGTYTVSVSSPANSTYAASNVATATVTVTTPPPVAQAVGISPASITVSKGASVSFTASGGQNGYVWGGSASGSGSGQTVTFGTVGTFTVSVMSPAGNGYSASNTASATITVNNPPPILHVVSVTIVGTGSVTGAGSYEDGDTCMLEPTPGADSYFAGFTGDKTGPGATSADTTPSISFTVTQPLSITAQFLTKLDQVVTLQNPGAKVVGSAPFVMSWTTNAGTTPAFSIVSGPATIDAVTGRVTLTGPTGTVTVRANFPSTFMYRAASVSTAFMVVLVQPSVVMDSQGGSIMLQGRVGSDFSAPGSPSLASAGAQPIVSGSDLSRAVVESTRNLLAGNTTTPTTPTTPTPDPDPIGGFPSNPTIGDVATVNGVRYIYTSAQKWVAF